MKFLYFKIQLMRGNDVVSETICDPHTLQIEVDFEIPVVQTENSTWSIVGFKLIPKTHYKNPRTP